MSFLNWFLVFYILCASVACGIGTRGASTSSSGAVSQSLQEWASMVSQDPTFSISFPMDSDEYPKKLLDAFVPGEDGEMGLPSRSAKRDAVVTLSDCARRGFNVNLTIEIGSNSSTHRLMVDTGSANVMVASSSCLITPANTPCPVPRPFITPVPGVSPIVTNFAYTSGSGTMYNDVYLANVGFTGVPGAKVNNAGIYLATSTSGTFFTPVGCFLDVQNYTNGDGLLGLGVQRSGEGTSFMDQLGKPAMAFQHCEAGGTMWLGQPNATLLDEPMQYTPMTESVYYATYPSAISVGGVDLGVSASSLSSGAILDNGATNMFFPTDIYSAIMAKLNANSFYNYYFGSKWATSACVGWPLASEVNTPNINKLCPNITITFPNGANMTINPVNGYMQQIYFENATVYYCNNIATTSGSIRLGLAAHAQFITHYDRPNSRFGWARTRSCNNEWRVSEWSSCCHGSRSRVAYCVDRFGKRLTPASPSAYMCQEANPYHLNETCTGACNSCPVEIEEPYGIRWSAEEESTQSQLCPYGYEGSASRYCSVGATWETSTASTNCKPIPSTFRQVPDSNGFNTSAIAPLDPLTWKIAGAIKEIALLHVYNSSNGWMGFMAWDCSALAGDASLSFSQGCTDSKLYKLGGYSTRTRFIVHQEALIASCSGYVQIWYCTNKPVQCVSNQVIRADLGWSFGSVVAASGSLIAMANPEGKYIRVYRCYNLTSPNPCNEFVVVENPNMQGFGSAAAMSPNGVLAVATTHDFSLVMLFDCAQAGPLNCSLVRNLTAVSSSTVNLQFVGTKLLIVQNSNKVDIAGTTLSYSCPSGAASCTPLESISGIISGVAMNGIGTEMAVYGDKIALAARGTRGFSSTSTFWNGAFVIMSVNDSSSTGFSTNTAVEPLVLKSNGLFGTTIGMTPAITVVSTARSNATESTVLYVMNTCVLLRKGSVYNATTGACTDPILTPSSTPATPVSSPMTTAPASVPYTSPTVPTASPTTTPPQISTPSTSPTSSPTSSPTAPTPSPTTVSPSITPYLSPSEPSDSPSSSPLATMPSTIPAVPFLVPSTPNSAPAASNLPATTPTSTNPCTRSFPSLSLFIGVMIVALLF